MAAFFANTALSKHAKTWLAAATLALSLSQVGYAADYAEADWQTIPQQNLWYLQTSTGTVVIEFADFMAPKHVARIKALTTSGFYDGLPFYRVIDGFVAQAGDGDEQKRNASPDNPLYQAMKAEFSRNLAKSSGFVVAQDPEFFAPRTGFIDGFPVAQDPKNQLEYLVHCRGSVNVARSNDANSGTTDFAIMMGQATRHLDNNMSQFGRVIWGLEHIAKLPVGDSAQGGVLAAPGPESMIIKARLGNQLAKVDQLPLQKLNSQSASFQQHLEFYRYRDKAEFFVNPTAHVVDVCYAKTPIRLTPKKA